jgi:Tfp pilus assembly protein PilF
MISATAILLFIAIIAGATAAYANVPIIVETGAGQRTLMKLCSDASDQLRKGDIAGAKRNVDAALRIDPRLCPALYDRAQIFRRQGKNEQTQSQLMTLRFSTMQLVATMFARTAQIRWKRARR